MEATKERSSLADAAERFRTRTTYASQPVQQYGLPDQCYRDMLQLATAAPDLLEALIEAREQISKEIGIPVNECVGAHFVNINAAIAKATQS